MLIDASGLPIEKKNPEGAGTSENTEQIFDAGEEDFMELVVNASMEIPVLVDFWAPWCEPCKQYTPIIEKAVRAEKGQVRLVKVNVDESQAIAQQLQIRSLPTTMVFVKGQPVQAIPGVLPADSLKKLLGDLLKMLGKGSSAEETATLLHDADQALNQDQAELAMGLYHQVFAQDEENAPAVAGILRAYCVLNDPEGAEEFFAALDASLQTSAEVQSAMKGLELLKNNDTADITEAKTRLEASSHDLSLRYALAEAYIGAQQNENAIEELLGIIRQNMDWEDKKAREKLLEIFEALGFSHPLAKAGRAQLSRILFS